MPERPSRSPDVLAAAPPALLLPMRIEYRFMPGGESIPVMRPRGRVAPGARGRARSDMSPGVSNSPHDRILFRWYPDTGFVHDGIPGPTDEEIDALHAFDAAVPTGAGWDDTSDPIVADAWRGFVAHLGGDVPRAIHLQRTRGATDAAAAQRARQVAALPETVVLFALKDGAKTTLLQQQVSGGAVHMAPADLQEDGWMVDFATARDRGMAAELADPVAVRAALDADWIIAVGVSGGASARDLNDLVHDLIANGGAEIIPQDTATNNSPNARVKLASKAVDPVARVAASVYAEAWRRAESGVDDSDAARVAEALGADPEVFRRLPAAATRDHLHAEDMARALLPALLDPYLLGTEGGFDLETLVDHLATTAFARGPLPTLRLGRNPYGILPVFNGADPEISEEGDERRAAVARLAHAVGDATVRALSPLAGSAPVIGPDDPDGTDKLESLLQQSAVSLRLDVADIGTGDLKALGCSYVESATHQPAVYLQDLATRSLSSLAAPSKASRAEPLLYRLAYVTLEVLDAQPAAAPIRDDRGRPDFTRPTTSSAWRRKTVASLKRLALLNRAELEVLMFEVLDLLTHRADALITSAATHRLAQLRRSGVSGLKVGYYGLLGKLRQRGVARSQGFVHAPSLQQATSAALLKSASLRNSQESAFQIDLSSSRTRQAIALLDLVNNGFSLSEALGYRAERWLHDAGEASLIYSIRERYPLDGGARDASRPLLNGLDLHKDGGAAAADLNVRQRGVVARLVAVLADAIDSLADLVTAEAVHAMAIGDFGAAQAWTQVLSGGAPPGALNFSATPRTGRARSWRFTFLCAPAAPRAGASPRSLVEPSLAAFVEKALPGVAGVTVRCSIGSPPGSSLFTLEPQRLRFTLGADLGLDAFDLVLGGHAELRRRASYAAYAHVVATFPEVAATLHAHAPDQPLCRTLATALTIDLDAGTGPRSLGALLETASALRGALTSLRPLTPADFDSAVEAGAASNEDGALAHAALGVSTLIVRVEGLVDSMGRVAARLEEAVETLATAVAQGLDTSAPQAAFDRRLDAASRFGLPEALRLFHSDALRDEGGGLHEAVRGHAATIAAALARKLARCLDALGLARAAAPEVEAQAGARRALSEALQAAVDGDALPVLTPVVCPSFPFQGLRPHDARSLGLDEWSRVRPRVGRLKSALERGLPVNAWSVSGSSPTFTPVYVAGDDVGAATQLSGGVVDEWSLVQRDSTQLTGVAVHYDAPQCEAPNALLLAVAHKRSQVTWTPSLLADSVVETIRLMRFRALPAPQAAYVNAGIGMSPKLARGAAGEQRLPAQAYQVKVAVSGGGLGLALSADLGSGELMARSLSERSRKT